VVCCLGGRRENNQCNERNNSAKQFRICDYIYFFTHMNEFDLMHLFQGCLGLQYSFKTEVNGFLLKHGNEAKYDKANNNKGIR